MKTQETTNGNKLIAEFMEFKKAIVRSSNGKQYDFDLPIGFILIKETETTIESEWCEILMEQDHCFVDELKFHSSWDWLMPVNSKIRTITFEEDGTGRRQECEVFKHTLNMFLFVPDIGKAFRVIVDFIKWYNENHKN